MSRELVDEYLQQIQKHVIVTGIPHKVSFCCYLSNKRVNKGNSLSAVPTAKRVHFLFLSTGLFTYMCNFILRLRFPIAIMFCDCKQ